MLRISPYCTLCCYFNHYFLNGLKAALNEDDMIDGECRMCKTCSLQRADRFSLNISVKSFRSLFCGCISIYDGVECTKFILNCFLIYFCYFSTTDKDVNNLVPNNGCSLRIRMHIENTFRALWHVRKIECVGFILQCNSTQFDL